MDQPLVQLSPLLAAWHQAQRGHIVATAYDGERAGVPAIFPATYFPAMRELTGETGARAVLHQHRGQVRRVSLTGADIDVDLPADLLRLAELAQTKDTP